VAETVRCSSCGASVRADAEWCGQCAAVIPHQPVVTDEEPIIRRPVPEQLALAAPHQYSRWRKGETSFGPFGKLSWSLVVVGIGAVFVWSGNPFAFVPWFVFVVPLVLRSLWARKRVS
jgi:hypothetical protein